MDHQLAGLNANTVFLLEDLIAIPGRPEEYALRYPIGADTILSPKANGQHELRDLSYVGNPDETCRVSSAGDVVYFPNVNGQRLAWPLVE